MNVAGPCALTGLSLSVVLLSACDGGGRPKESAAPRQTASAPATGSSAVAGRMAQHLKLYGQAPRARVVLDPATRLTRLETPYLVTWEVYQVVNESASHRRQFAVATGPAYSFVLTANPKGFNALLRAAKVRVTDTGTAVAVTRTYLAATRPTNVVNYLVNSPGEVKLRRGLSGDERKRALEKCCSSITPPSAAPSRDGFVVTAYVVRERELQRRTVTITSAGAVTEASTPIAKDLPAPVSP